MNPRVILERLDIKKEMINRVYLIANACRLTNSAETNIPTMSEESKSHYDQNKPDFQLSSTCSEKFHSKNTSKGKKDKSSESNNLAIEKKKSKSFLYSTTEETSYHRQTRSQRARLISICSNVSKTSTESKPNINLMSEPVPCTKMENISSQKAKMTIEIPVENKFKQVSKKEKVKDNRLSIQTSMKKKLTETSTVKNDVPVSVVSSILSVCNSDDLISLTDPAFQVQHLNDKNLQLPDSSLRNQEKVCKSRKKTRSKKNDKKKILHKNYEMTENSDCIINFQSQDKQKINTDSANSDVLPNQFSNCNERSIVSIVNSISPRKKDSETMSNEIFERVDANSFKIKIKLDNIVIPEFLPEDCSSNKIIPNSLHNKAMKLPKKRKYNKKEDISQDQVISENILEHTKTENVSSRNCSTNRTMKCVPTINSEIVSLPDELATPTSSINLPKRKKLKNDLSNAKQQLKQKSTMTTRQQSKKVKDNVTCIKNSVINNTSKEVNISFINLENIITKDNIHTEKENDMYEKNLIQVADSAQNKEENSTAISITDLHIQTLPKLVNLDVPENCITEDKDITFAKTAYFTLSKLFNKELALNIKDILEKPKVVEGIKMSSSNDVMLIQNKISSADIIEPLIEFCNAQKWESLKNPL